jgi:hypothetical protein
MSLMPQTIRLSATFAMLATALQLTGCASIVSGSNQPISVETQTADGKQLIGANCRLSNDKGTWFITTPGSTTVHRSYENLSVQCDKENQPAGFLQVPSSTKAMAFGNILAGGVIGAGVDVATGAAYDYPSLILVRMGLITLPPTPVANSEAKHD